MAGFFRDRANDEAGVRRREEAEILSPSNARNDLVKKQRTLHGAAVPHYWVVDPDRKSLAVLRHHAEDYVTVLAVGPGETVRAEPFGQSRSRPTSSSATCDPVPERGETR